MLTLILTIVTIALLVLLNGLYVAAEFASVSARKTRISQMAGSGNSLARFLLPVVTDSRALDHYVAACQVGITATSLVLGAYGQNSVAVVLAPLLVSLGGLAEPVALTVTATGVLIFLTTFQVVLGELFPKSIAIQYPEKVALATVIPMRWSGVIFRPFIWLLNGSGDLLLNLLGIGRDPGHPQGHSPQEIELLVTESYLGGLLDDEEKQMLRNAFRLRELAARQVMVPRTRLLAAPATSSVTEVMNKACLAGFTRIPLYQDTIDNIIGFVHIRDLFQLHVHGQQDPTGVLREVLHVPESLPVVDVWDTLNKNRQYIAVVFDEYGGTAGLITLEDLIEEIFGELQDEFDEEIPIISSDIEGRIHLRGDVLVTDVNEYLDVDLPDEAADTLGGLVFSELGRIPQVGEQVLVGQPPVSIRVEAMAALSITEVSLQMPTDGTFHVGEWEGYE